MLLSVADEIKFLVFFITSGYGLYGMKMNGEAIIKGETGRLSLRFPNDFSYKVQLFHRKGARKRKPNATLINEMPEHLFNIIVNAVIIYLLH